MATERASGRGGRGLRIALLVSLALNLMVVGVVAGGIASGRIGGDKPARVGLDLGPLARMLEPEDRRAIGRSIRETATLRPLSPRQRRADLAEIADLLRADPFDAAAMEEAMTRQRRAASQVITAAQSALLDRLDGMPLEQRQAYADRLDAEISQIRGGGPRGGGSGGDHSKRD